MAKSLHPTAGSRSKDVWNALLTLRTLNAILLCTFFQPDEYYQAQEPAWAFAFGPGSNGHLDGPWLTWVCTVETRLTQEWYKQLRSSLYPVVLGTVYKASYFIGRYIFAPSGQAKLLLASPKILGAFSATFLDFYTWRLSERLFGAESISSFTVVSCLTQLLFQLYISAASPWQWFVSTRTLSNSLETTLTVVALYYWPWTWLTDANIDKRNEDRKRLFWAFLFAGIATMLRPNNALIWVLLSFLTLPCAFLPETFAFIRTAASVGPLVLISCAAIDAAFYGNLTFPPLRFLSLNVTEGIADFYGKMRLDYYFTEGVPLIMTTMLPFCLIGAYQAKTAVLKALRLVALGVAGFMSLLNHKEVRFLYPIYPILVVLSAGPIASFFEPIPIPRSSWRKATLVLILVFNVAIAIYAGMFHGRGVLMAGTFLREEHERRNPDLTSLWQTERVNKTEVLFLMPCHSVPWRSNFVYPGIIARSLTCEPPLGMGTEQREHYLDEADVFYQDPVAWLNKELTHGKWPMYLVFFQQLSSKVAAAAPKDYNEVWRGFNSIVHDDWRRKGDVVIWRKQ